MSQKKQKLKRKILSNIPKLEAIQDQAFEQCFHDDDVFNEWIVSSCEILHSDPDFPLEDLLPKQMAYNILSNIIERRANQS